MGLLPALAGRLNALVFTGGIGEHSPRVREKACSYLAVLGIELNEDLNQQPTTENRMISKKGTLPVLIIPTNEELEIALQTEQIVSH